MDSLEIVSNPVIVCWTVVNLFKQNDGVSIVRIKHATLFINR